MLILAIDTSARHFSLALLNDNELVGQFDSQNVEADKQAQPNGKQSLPPGASVNLFPAMRELLRDHSIKLDEIDLIAVAVGPGSFTGLRTGVVAAKTLSYVNQTPLVGVNTLDIIAAQIGFEAEKSDFQAIDGSNLKLDLARPIRVKVVVNAQRQQVFCASIQLSPQNLDLQRSREDQIKDRDAWIRSLESNDVVTGSGLKQVMENLMGLKQPTPIWLAPQELWNSSAKTAGRLALARFEAGHRDDLWRIEPFYFRPSAAEEVLAAKSLKN